MAVARTISQLLETIHLLPMRSLCLHISSALALPGYQDLRMLKSLVLYVHPPVYLKSSLHYL